MKLKFSFIAASIACGIAVNSYAQTASGTAGQRSTLQQEQSANAGAN